MILILTAAYGEGHNAAARGLHAAFAELGIESEVADIFAVVGGAAYERSREAYIELINRVPAVWGGVYSLIDKFPVVPLMMPFLGDIRRALAALLEEKKPSTVISVYPAYGYLIENLFPDQAARPFALHTVVTDSITINSVWHRCPSDTFLVPNEDSARVMTQAGVPEPRLHVFGFPVPPRFARDRPARSGIGPGSPPRILFMINAGKDTAHEIVARLCQLESIRLTVTVGRDEALRDRVTAAAAGREVEIHGWIPHMPELLMTHHLLIGKAGGAAVQETIAACTPMLITHAVPGQEEGNARLLIENGCGELCETPDALAAAIERLFADDAREWRQWERNIARLSRPDAALRIAEFVRPK